MKRYPLVKGLWIGKTLPLLQRKCLEEFLLLSHHVELYVFDSIENLPPGITLKNAEEIMPRSQIFQYQVGEGKGSFSACSNLFRYLLLFKKGGIWIDLDIFPLRPLAYEADYVFASETVRLEQDRILASCFIKVPPQSPLMASCVEIALQKDWNTIEWGEIGPQLLTQQVKKFNLEKYVLPSWEICPLGWDETELLTKPSLNWHPPKRSKAVHLNNEMLRRQKMELSEKTWLEIVKKLTGSTQSGF
jgi:hypothetical protein